MKDRSVFDRYKTFLEEHFSREGHNTQEVVTKHLTVTTEGSFDYVSIDWTIRALALEKDHPEWLINQ